MLHIEFYTDTVERSGYKMERSGLEPIDRKPLHARKIPDSFSWSLPQGTSYYYSEHIKH